MENGDPMKRRSKGFSRDDVFYIACFLFLSHSPAFLLMLLLILYISSIYRSYGASRGYLVNNSFYLLENVNIDAIASPPFSDILLSLFSPCVPRHNRCTHLFAFPGERRSRERAVCQPSFIDSAVESRISKLTETERRWDILNRVGRYDGTYYRRHRGRPANTK